MVILCLSFEYIIDIIIRKSVLHTCIGGQKFDDMIVASSKPRDTPSSPSSEPKNTFAKTFLLFF